MNTDEQTVSDPVCGMKLGADQIKETLVYRDRSFYFCSVACRAEFQRHADEYFERAQSAEDKNV